MVNNTRGSPLPGAVDGDENAFWWTARTVYDQSINYYSDSLDGAAKFIRQAIKEDIEYRLSKGFDLGSE